MKFQIQFDDADTIEDLENFDRLFCVGVDEPISKESIAYYQWRTGVAEGIRWYIKNNAKYTGEMYELFDDSFEVLFSRIWNRIRLTLANLFRSEMGSESDFMLSISAVTIHQNALLVTFDF